MQLKTIRKNIEAKMNAWLETIPDGLRERVRESLLVSGGSITSMLLNEKVNDYDVYLQDRVVLFDLVKHYLGDKFEVLDGGKRDEYMKGLGEDYKNPSVNLDTHNAWPVLSVRNLKPEQVKIMVQGGKKLNEDVKDEDRNFTPVFISPNAISFSNDVQLVSRFSGTPDEIHKSFDFIHATNYFTFKDGLVTNIKALESVISRQLMYQGSLYPITSVIRMRKFIKRGWNINAGEILKMCMQVSELNLSDPNILEEQLIGVDIAYFEKLVSILRGIDPEKINASYIAEIIDRVFAQHDGDPETEVM